ncbi:MAG: ABC transporter substrate-binding protein [Candidatus Methanomethyliaceae archaeon]
MIKRVVLAGVALLFCGGLMSGVEIVGPTIKIGGIFPITGRGADCGWAEHIGAQLAVNEINAAGGVNGVPIELIVCDSAGRPEEAVALLRRLAYGDKVLAVVGPHYSSEAEVTFPAGNLIGIVQIAVASSKPGISAANRPWPFRNTITEDKIAMPVVKALIQDFGIKTVAIMYDSKEAVCASLGRDVFPPVLEAEGLVILNKDAPITFETGKPYFMAEITRLKALNPDAVMLGALGTDALNIVSEARRQGLMVPFFGGAPLFEGYLPQRGGEMVNNVYGGTIWYYEDPSEKNQRFVQGYAELASKMYPQASPIPTYYAANAYDAIYMLKEAIEKMGITNKPEDLAQDRAKIRDYLAQLRDFDGLASRGFNEVGDGIKNVYVLKTFNGKWELVLTWSYTE